MILGMESPDLVHRASSGSFSRRFGPATQAVGHVLSKVGKVSTYHSQPYGPPVIGKAAPGNLAATYWPGDLGRKRGTEKKEGPRGSEKENQQAARKGVGACIDEGHLRHL